MDRLLLGDHEPLPGLDRVILAEVVELAQLFGLQAVFLADAVDGFPLLDRVGFLPGGCGRLFLFVLGGFEPTTFRPPKLIFGLAEWTIRQPHLNRSG